MMKQLITAFPENLIEAIEIARSRGLHAYSTVEWASDPQSKE
jgi:hypothetical protein